jgi:hypothetical protein
MIICESEKWIFIRNPKTASRSITDFLINNFNCFEYGKYHSVDIPKCYSNFKIYLTIRNPLSRAVSAWNHILDDSNKGYDNRKNINFSQYLKEKNLKANKTGDGFNFFYQSDLIKKIDNSNVNLIYYEKLNSHLNYYFKKCILRKIGVNNFEWKSLYSNNLLVNYLNKDLEVFKFYGKILI